MAQDDAEVFKRKVLEVLRSRANTAYECGHDARGETFSEIASIVASIPAK